MTDEKKRPQRIVDATTRGLFFSCTTYYDTDIQRLLWWPEWLQRMRKMYVWCLDWTDPRLRAGLGIR